MLGRVEQNWFEELQSSAWGLAGVQSNYPIPPACTLLCCREESLPCRKAVTFWGQNVPPLPPLCATPRLAAFLCAFRPLAEPATKTINLPPPPPSLSPLPLSPSSSPFFPALSQFFSFGVGVGLEIKARREDGFLLLPLLLQSIQVGEGGRRGDYVPAMGDRGARERDPFEEEEEEVEEGAVGGRRRASVLSLLDLKPIALPPWALAEGPRARAEPKREVKEEIASDDEDKENPICSIASVEGGAVERFYGTAKNPSADDEMASETSSSPRTWGSAPHEYLRIEMLPEEVAESCQVK